MGRRINMRAIHLLIIPLCVVTLALPAWAQWGIMDEEVPADHRKGRDRDRDDEEEEEEEEEKEEDKEEEEEDGWDDEEEKEDNGEGDWEDGMRAGEDGGEDEEEEEDDEDGKEDRGLKENPEDKLFYLGARLRWIMIPEWMIGVAIDTKQSSKYRSSLPLVSNVGAGLEFIFRRDGLDISAAIWYAGLGWDPISIKQKGEPDYSYEVVENDMRSVLFTTDFMWSVSFTDWLAFSYGFGFGMGVRWGDLVRTEASAGSDYFEKCEGPNNETGLNDEGCAADSEGDYGEYGATFEKFKVFPWLEVLMGLRFKPHRHMAIYVDGGWGFGFQVGLRAGYIF